MDPLTIGAILGSAKVAKAIHDFAADEAKSVAKESAGSGFKSLIWDLPEQVLSHVYEKALFGHGLRVPFSMSALAI
jgi:hypothetical protein